MSSTIKFSVVREDPLVEHELISRFGLSRSLLVASAGDTALFIADKWKSHQITLFDINSMQLNLVRRKIEALLTIEESLVPSYFGVEKAGKETLSGAGEFESLFRCFSHFIHEFVIDSKRLELLFLKGEPLKKDDALFKNKYWPVAFELFFSDSILVTMFGKEAVQNAQEKYPTYFERVMRAGFCRKDMGQNYFLHHLFLDKYLSHAYPSYIHKWNEKPALELIEGNFDCIKNIEKYDLIQFSNIFDWMDESGIREILSRISRDAKSGTVLLWRQLNNAKDYTEYLGPDFDLLGDIGQTLMQKDRSLFYSSIVIARKK